MILATIRLGIRNLSLHKLRSFLTMLGTILGVASVISMIAVGEGSKRHAVEQIRQLGSTNVILRSVKPQQKNESNGSSSGSQQQVSRVLNYGLKYADFRLVSALPTLDMSVPLVVLRKTAYNGKRQMGNARVVGTVPEYLKIKKLSVRRGRFFSPDDIKATVNVTVLGPGAAQRLFGFDDPMGKLVLLGEGAYRVIGVLRSQHSAASSAGGVGISDQNEDILIPLSCARNRFGEVQVIVRAGSREYERVELSEITLAVSDELLVSQTAAMARRLLKKHHPGGDDFEVQVPLELLAQAEREKQIWNMVLGSIAGISLLVGGIGIMNIMLATVTERTKEIGIRRALGARQRDIVFQFLVETTALSTIGGIAGIGVGLVIPVAVTRIFGIETAIAWWSGGLAFIISVLTGIVFGVYPARRAALMDPVEALRH
ncbi:MAG TPA: FtsX-like permease family protein [Planctomycetes bacterium]|nr:FtsX-like permease family protein [Planctomycetota bacterium]